MPDPAECKHGKLSYYCDECAKEFADLERIDALESRLALLETAVRRLMEWKDKRCEND